MDPIRWEERPALRRPVLVAGFEGWNDAGDAASLAVGYLAKVWGGRAFAVIDPEDFYDFTVVRPRVRLVEGVTRHIDWPEGKLSAAAPPGARHDIVFLQAAEPQLRWRSYADALIDMAKQLGVEMVLTLGALLADVAHTQPVRVTGTAASSELADSLGFQRSRYEGPTGIVGVFHDACSRAGLPSASLWAAVPHYVSATPSPKAALVLVERTAALLGIAVDVTELQLAAAAYERQVSEVVADDEDVAAYVQRLEELGEDEDDNEPVPSGDALAAEVERFLRDQS